MSEQGETIRKNITYDTVEDKEIHEWFESLPPRTHSLYIRKALKEHISGKTNTSMNQFSERLDRIEEILKTGDITDYKNADEQKNKDLKSEEETNNNYVDADHVLKDLGK